MNPRTYQWLVRTPTTSRGWLGGAVLLAVVLCVLHWSAEGAQLSWGELASGLPQIGDFLGRSLPPDLSILPNLWRPALETLQIALWGTLLGIMGAIPLGLLAARNLHDKRWLYQGTRQLLNVIRSINELILALVFVSAVGLGPFPGVLALASTFYIGALLIDELQNLHLAKTGGKVSVSTKNNIEAGMSLPIS